MRKTILILLLALAPCLSKGDPASPSDQLRTSGAYAASLVAKVGPGRLISLVGYNSKASAQFIQVHDANALPADAAVPVYTFSVAATSNFSLDIPITGAPMANGVVVCNSSTGPTKTIGSADVFFSVVVTK